MSRSNVRIATPCNTAATPPTTIKSTRWAASVLRIASKSGSVVFCTNSFDGSQIVLQCSQTFVGRERQKPANERQIHAVGTVRRFFNRVAHTIGMGGVHYSVATGTAALTAARGASSNVTSSHSE